MTTSPPNRRTEPAAFSFEGKRYLYQDGVFHDTLRIRVPKVMELKLRNHFAERLAAQDATMETFEEILRGAMQARDAGDYERARTLCERATTLKPKHHGVATVHSTVLRKVGRSAEAIRVAELQMPTASVSLLTTYAAALLDEGRAEEALRIARKAYALAKESRFSTHELGRVFDRIKSEFPDIG